MSKISKTENFYLEFVRLTGLKDSEGNYVFKNGRLAFEFLNERHNNENGFYKYSSYESFKAAKSKSKKK